MKKPWSRNPILILLITFMLLLAASFSYALTSSEVEGELMCNCGCGDLLVNCTCGEADELRGIIGNMIDEGKSKDEIVDAFVARFGDVILSAPPKRGFNLIAYIMPFVGLLLGITILIWFVSRWKRVAAATASPDGRVSELDPEMEDRIKSELDHMEEDQ